MHDAAAKASKSHLNVVMAQRHVIREDSTSLPGASQETIVFASASDMPSFQIHINNL
jgi:hypothetical protein